MIFSDTLTLVKRKTHFLEDICRVNSQRIFLARNALKIQPELLLYKFSLDLQIRLLSILLPQSRNHLYLKMLLRFSFDFNKLQTTSLILFCRSSLNFFTHTPNEFLLVDLALLLYFLIGGG